MSLAKENRAKYLKPPTYQEIEEFRALLGVNIATFERFYDITQGTIKKIRKGKENLPAKVWHFVYKKIVPKYGLSISLTNTTLKNVRGTKRGKSVNKSASKEVLNKLSHLQ